MIPEFQYQGNELFLFQRARNWKKYFASTLKPFIIGKVLEAGAGIGSNTPFLYQERITQWLLMEPDEKFSLILEKSISEGKLPSICSVINGTINNIKEDFDCIIYIDVLEHIELDRDEIQKATSHLRPGGYLLVLCPAFQHLFSPFDKAIGHFRRYSKKDFRLLTPKELEIISCKYYDSMGYFAAIANKFILKQKYPTESQIIFWDKWLIPFSIYTDTFLSNFIGKSIISVWRKKL